MHVLADVTIIPLGVGLSLSPYVAEVERIFADRGLHHDLHANGTNVEGPWEEVMEALRACHERLHEMGAPRVHTVLKLGTRTDRTQSLGDKVASVQRHLGLSDGPSEASAAPQPH